jgi:hypothetical protein
MVFGRTLTALVVPDKKLVYIKWLGFLLPKVLPLDLEQVDQGLNDLFEA